MEVDTLNYTNEAIMALQAYNTRLFITTLLMMNLVVVLVLFISFRVSSNKQTQKVFLPLLVILAVLTYPIFSGLNLWQITWLPQLSFPYELPLGSYLTAFDSFSLFYWDRMPYVITIVYFILVALFIQYLYKQNYFSKAQRFLLFVPFINHILIAQYFLQLKNSVLKKSICMLLIFVSCVHWFYRTIGLVLLIYGIDTYSWYYNIVFGSPVEYVMNDTIIPYTLFSDYLFQFNMSLTFISALCMFPVYFILNKLETVQEVEDATVKNPEVE